LLGGGASPDQHAENVIVPQDEDKDVIEDDEVSEA
jgi:hypothetical protein